MPRIIRLGRRGSFLAQALVMVMLLALIGSLVLKLVLGRRTLAYRADSAAASRQRALGAQSYLQACLDGTGFNNTDCNLPACAAPAPAIDGHAVTVTAGGSAPNCTLSIVVAGD